MKTPIDSLVDAKLATANLKPALDADPCTLVRRLYAQLVGLPPTQKQLEAYLNDERPGALERLVDTLLLSSHFGECWGQHWLELARYADSNGLDETFLFRETWRSRDQVIDSFNNDVPYDQFLREQIAYDLLPYQTSDQRDRQRIAAGVWVVGPKVLLNSNKELQ